MEKLTPIQEIITKHIADESCEFVIVRKEHFMVTDKKMLLVQPLHFFSIPEEQVKCLEGKAFSKETFREVERAEDVRFEEDGVYCVSKSGTVRKKVFYNEAVEFNWQKVTNLAINLLPSDGNGISALQFAKLGKCMLKQADDLFEIYQVENTNLKVVVSPGYKGQYALIAI